MRIAAIYWPTSSVGGIATEALQLKKYAESIGDTFHILESGSKKTFHAGLLDKPKSIRGGDTRITIDGYAPHHPNNIVETVEFLEANYDMVYMLYLVPHETKAYPTPDFLPMFDVKLPIIGRITDAYWETYKHWAKLVLPKVKEIFVCCDAYAEPILAQGVKVTKSKQPFCPPEPGSVLVLPDYEPLLVWPSQWKAIKGVKKFLSIVPKITSTGCRVEMYSNGIEYYQLRGGDAWSQAVGLDHFAGFNGQGEAEFYGHVEYSKVREFMSRAWFSVNLQGHAAKYLAYKRGGYNNTEIEALYYGALPIVHQSVEDYSGIPKHLIVGVDHEDQIPMVTASEDHNNWAMNVDRRREAREWVLETHGVEKVYRRMFYVGT